MWSVVAKRDLTTGTLIGFYTGDMQPMCPPGSHYALQFGATQPCIVPFPNEKAISSVQRDTHPLASMNEPEEHYYANCYMVAQDFAADEIEGVTALEGHGTARFFRGMACFACTDIRAGHTLTWNYGPAYEAIRQLVGYTAGWPCRRVMEHEAFIEAKSQSVLSVLPKVPHYCVYPVRQSQCIHSLRFKLVHRRHSVDSEGEPSETESSGSGAEEAYRPRPTKKRSEPLASP